MLLVWLFTLPAILPLAQPVLLHTADGLLHLYRVAALSQAVSQGALFPRWLPDLAYGYGFPLFVFYAPLSYYIPLILNSLGLNLVIAFNLSFGLALLLTGSGMYLFVKILLSPKAGLLASVAYVYAPFQLLNTLSRGGLPAAWAMALFPFVFWIFAKLIRSPKVKFLNITIPVAAFIFGLALLTHNTLTLLFVPLLGLYLAVDLLVCWRRQLKLPPSNSPQRGEDEKSSPLLEKIKGGAAKTRITNLKIAILQVGVALLLGVGVAAFFLLPAILEKEFAQVHRVIISPDFDFRFHFVTLAELFTLPRPAYTGLLNPDYPLSLGPAQAVLALIGWISSVIYLTQAATRWPPDHFEEHSDQTSSPSQPTKAKYAETLHSPLAQSDMPDANQKNPSGPLSSHLLIVFIFSTLALAGTLFMMLPVSLWVWEQIPLLAFVQFPHRLLGPLALVLAVLAGTGASVLPNRVGFIATLAGVSLIILTSIPFLYPHYRLPAPDPTLLDMMAYEHAGGAIGTTSFGEYLPVWVKQIPAGSPLEPMYRAGASIERLDPASLSTNATIESTGYGFNRAEITINSPESYQIIYQAFYFPGWTALIDGQPATITPATPTGLIGIDMPAGQHHLHLSFQETALRKTANGISAVSLIIVVTLLIINVLRVAWNGNQVSTQHATRSTPGFNHRQLITLTGLAVFFILAKLIYLDNFDSPFKQTFNGTDVAWADKSPHINFGDQVNLLGYQFDTPTVEAGETLNLTAFWQARYPLAADYSALAQLVDAERNWYSGQDNLHPGRARSSQWPPESFVQDAHSVPVHPGTPAGDYFLILGLYNAQTGGRLPIFTESEMSWGDVIAIPVTVTSPDHPPAIAQLGIAQPIETGFGPELRLLGYTRQQDKIPRNDFLRTALFWEAVTAPTVNYHVSLRLLDSGGNVVAQETSQPSFNRYPTTTWAAGERVRDNHAVWIPLDFPAGMYQLQVQVLDAQKVPVNDWVDLDALSTAE